jgi:hypothetical protein
MEPGTPCEPCISRSPGLLRLQIQPQLRYYASRIALSYRALQDVPAEIGGIM